MTTTLPDDDERVHGWVTVPEARAVWPGAPKTDDVLVRMLVAAHEMCLEYAPELGPARYPELYEPQFRQAVPERFRQAQILQARAIWRTTRDNADAESIGGDYEINTPTMTGRILQMLRPPSMTGLIG